MNEPSEKDSRAKPQEHEPRNKPYWPREREGEGANPTHKARGGETASEPPTISPPSVTPRKAKVAGSGLAERRTRGRQRETRRRESRIWTQLSKTQ